jgi:hypothetical protein
MASINLGLEHTAITPAVKVRHRARKFIFGLSIAHLGLELRR